MSGGGEVYEVRINNRNKGFAVYSTPDRAVFEEPILMDEWTFEWLMCSHILGAKEIVWLK